MCSSDLSFTLADGESQTFANIAPGSVTINESTVPAGWELDDVSCNVPFTQAGSEIEVTLEYGDEGECVYTNAELAPATLTVVKEDEPSTWDPAFDFNASGTGLVAPGQPGSQDFTLNLGDSQSFSVRPVAAGNTYTVTESAPPSPPSGESGFELTNVECVVNGDTANPISGDTGTGVVQVLLEPGDDAVCAYTNKQLPRLRIVKKAVDPGDPADDTSFDYSATGLTPTNFSLNNSANNRAFTDVAVSSSFDVTEVPVANWTLTSLACTGQGSSAVSTDVSSGQVSSTGLTYGDDVVCTYVNTKEPAQAYLFVLKSTDPAGATADFDFTATGFDLDASFTLTGDGDFKGFEVDPGFGGQTYTVTELPKTGWRLTELDCVKSSDPSTPIPGDLGTGEVDITLLQGEVGVCVYENQKLGTLSVNKVTSVQSTTEFDFTATGVTPGSFSLTGGGAPQVYTGIAPGTEVVVTEDVPTDAPERWSLTDLVCDGAQTWSKNLAQAKATVTVGAGEDVDCSFTDTRVPDATVQIVKVADPADGTQFDFTASGADGGVDI